MQQIVLIVEKDEKFDFSDKPLRINCKYIFKIINKLDKPIRKMVE